jgi:pimeloyl-ACP methyl ester carboxylesterase
MVSHTGAERLLAALPDTRHEELARIGHCPQVEAPDAVADLLLDFASRSAGSLWGERDP